jgi:hypothetical protein
MLTEDSENYAKATISLLHIARYDFRINTMCGSSLLPVVSRGSLVLFTFFVFVCD